MGGVQHDFGISFDASGIGATPNFTMESDWGLVAGLGYHHAMGSRFTLDGLLRFRDAAFLVLFKKNSTAGIVGCCVSDRSGKQRIQHGQCRATSHQRFDSARVFPVLVLAQLALALRGIVTAELLARPGLRRVPLSPVERELQPSNW